MRLLKGLVFVLIFTVPPPLLAIPVTDGQQLEEFNAEKHDKELLQAKRIDRKEAASWIFWLVILVLGVFGFLVFYQWWIYEPSASSTDYRSKFSSTKTRGQGANVDPLRGVGNDPL